MEQAIQLSQADIVIIACGYQSTQVPILDLHGMQVPLFKNRNRGYNEVPGIQLSKKASLSQAEQIDVNQYCQLMNQRTGQPIPGLFGIGQGYSLETSDLSVNAEQRIGAKADSVGLYIKQIGNKILTKILPYVKARLLMAPMSPAFPLATPSKMPVVVKGNQIPVDVPQ